MASCGELVGRCLEQRDLDSLLQACAFAPCRQRSAIDPVTGPLIVTALAGCAAAVPAKDIVDTAVAAAISVPGQMIAQDEKAGERRTVQGRAIRLATAGGVTVDGARVSRTDIAADNGVIHRIDRVHPPR